MKASITPFTPTAFGQALRWMRRSAWHPLRELRRVLPDVTFGHA